MPTVNSTLDRQVRDLIDRHREVKRNGELLFAGWFDKGNPNGDVCLFEVFEHFPDSGIGRLDTYLFPSSQEFPMVGSLRLTITSPAELREAVENQDTVFRAIQSSKDREVIYPDNKDWDQAIEELLP